MATQVQFRRGTTSETSLFTGALAEVTVDTTKDTCVVHDGVTAGGFPLLRQDGSNSALSAGSLSSCALKFASSANTGIYSPGANQIALVSSGIASLLSSSSGNITIPGNLTVSGSFSAAITSISVGNTSSTVTDTGSNGTFSVTTEGSLRQRINSTGQFLYGKSGGFTTPPGMVSAQTGGGRGSDEATAWFGNDNNELIGVGLLSSVPSTIGMELNFLKTRSDSLNSISAQVLANDVIGAIGFAGTTSGGTALGCAAIRVIAEANITTSTSPGRITIHTTTPGATTVSEKVRIDGNGFTTFTGSIGRGAPVTKTGNFTLAITENWIICNGTATITVTLPAASSWTGREVMLKTIAAFTVISASANVVPLAGGAASTAILAATAGKYVALVSDGTNWIIMEAN
jgi:hypothetical protein